MYKKIVGILILGLFIVTVIPLTGFIESVKADPGDVILSFDSPAQRPWDLTWDGQYLWIVAAEYSLGDSNPPPFVIYKFNPSNGSIITSFNSPGGCCGLTWDGNYLWCSKVGSYPDGIGMIYKLDPSDGNIITSFNSPGHYPTGLTWDGQCLWNADFDNNKIYKIDPLDGSIITSFASPDINTTGLAWDGQYLWSIDSNEFSLEEKGKIYKLNPSDGSIITSFNSPGFFPTGLTWDGEYLWNSDYIGDTYPKIYKIDVGSSGGESDISINEISGGFGVSATIVNNGMESVYNVSWSLDVQASIGLILSGSHTEDIIDELAVGGSVTIQTYSLRGIGLITITIQAADAEKQATAFLLGPLVLRLN